MKIGKKLLFLLLFFALVWLPAFAWFYQQIPTQQDYIPLDTAGKADAIVVLTGGTGRFDKGLQLLMAGKAQELLVSGVDKDVRPRELVEMYGIQIHHPALANGVTQIALDHGPHNTVGNAESTAEWMRQRGFKSIYLVTSSYHMPRSLLEFQQAMPDAIILPEPAFPEWGAIDKVFLVSRGSLRLILLEFHKYIARRLYYALPESWQIFSRLQDKAMPNISMMTLGAPSDMDKGLTPSIPETPQP